LLPWGKLARTLALAGPGVGDVAADIVLVPLHPQTGEHWPFAGAAEVVPLAWDVWVYLVDADDRSAPLPPGPFRPEWGDFRSAPLPAGPFRPDWGVFRSALARQPEVRQPWLRKIYDHVMTHPYAHPF
jgi:hypothetical protein